MESKIITYEKIPNCCELTVNNQRLIVSTDFGPRIIHLSLDEGENILFHDKEQKLSFQDWLLYGGHRLWISPETHATYNPDNDLCTINEIDDKMTFTSFDSKLQLEKSITISEKNGRFLVDHIILNKSDTLYPGAIWAITCVNPEGTAFFPWGTPGNWVMNKVVFWQKWMNHSTDIKSSQYIPTKDLYLVKATGEEGKVGTAGHEGFIGISQNNYTFIKKFNRITTNQYPDDNCAIELYTCKHFIELETLSPKTVFMPNVPFSHQEEWILVNKKVEPEKGKDIRKLL